MRGPASSGRPWERHRHRLAVLFAGLPWVLAIASPAAARVIELTPSPTAIQAAVDSATAPDTLLLAPGTYATTTRVFLNKGITILSAAGPALTIVDLQYHFGSVFVVLNASAPPTIVGLTIRRGAEIFTGAGGGIYIENSSPTIRDCIIEANGATNIEGIGGAGGGVAAFGGAPIIENNTIVGNWAGSGGVYLEQSAAVVDHNLIAYNSAFDQPSAEGYGISCNLSPAASVHDNLLWANLPGDVYASCADVSSNNITTVDPLFCDPRYPNDVERADWRVGAGSPILPGHTYSAWGAPATVCAVTTTRAVTWGRMKAQYR